MLVHRVALESGAGWDIDAIMNAMSMRQLTEWSAFFEIQREYEEQAMEEARSGKKRPGPPGKKVYATPEFADLHMRLWSNAHKFKGPAKA